MHGIDDTRRTDWQRVTPAVAVLAALIAGVSAAFAASTISYIFG